MGMRRKLAKEGFFNECLFIKNKEQANKQKTKAKQNNNKKNPTIFTNLQATYYIFASD